MLLRGFSIFLLKPSTSPPQDFPTFYISQEFYYSTPQASLYFFKPVYFSTSKISIYRRLIIKMEFPVPITVVSGAKTKWTKMIQRASALGITMERLLTLQQSFINCDTIDKTRSIRENTEKKLFIDEVYKWLEKELTDDDRRNIYGRHNLNYHPGYAVYNVATYFKRKWRELEKQRVRRQRLAPPVSSPTPRTPTISFEIHLDDDPDVEVDYSSLFEDQHPPSPPTPLILTLAPTADSHPALSMPWSPFPIPNSPPALSIPCSPSPTPNSPSALSTPWYFVTSPPGSYTALSTPRSPFTSLTTGSPLASSVPWSPFIAPDIGGSGDSGVDTSNPAPVHSLGFRPLAAAPEHASLTATIASRQGDEQPGPETQNPAKRKLASEGSAPKRQRVSCGDSGSSSKSPVLEKLLSQMQGLGDQITAIQEQAPTWAQRLSEEELKIKIQAEFSRLQGIIPQFS